MPANKNAVLRYMLLDEYISDIHNDYTRKDLYEKVNDALMRMDDKYHVSERTIDDDIHDMESIFGFDFEFPVINGKKRVKYPDPSFRAFAKPLHEDEKKLLREVLNTLGQFSGLDNFEWLGELKEKLSLPNSFAEQDCTQNKVISFSQNEYLQNKDYLAWFFYAISNKVVVKFKLRPFLSTTPIEKIVYPYMLKQYNNRWYLIGTPVGTKKQPYCPDTLENYPLDRILEYSEEHDIDYVMCPLDIEEYYEDVIGLTNRADVEAQEVLMAISPLSAEYVRTKPLHWSQVIVPESESAELAARYNVPADYVFFKITCKDNYELRSVLRSFGSNLLVLSPEKLRKEMISEMDEHRKLYKGI